MNAGMLLLNTAQKICNADPAGNAGVPSISLPSDLLKNDGLPVGIEVDGLPVNDNQLLAIVSVRRANWDAMTLANLYCEDCGLVRPQSNHSKYFGEAQVQTATFFEPLLDINISTKLRL